MSLSEEFITIPMYGFTESYNISVSVAITLYELVHRAKANPAYPLSEYEKEVVLPRVKKIREKLHIVEKRFVAEYINALSLWRSLERIFQVNLTEQDELHTVEMMSYRAELLKIMLKIDFIG